MSIIPFLVSQVYCSSTRQEAQPSLRLKKGMIYHAACQIIASYHETSHYYSYSFPPSNSAIVEYSKSCSRFLLSFFIKNTLTFDKTFTGSITSHVTAYVKLQTLSLFLQNYEINKNIILHERNLTSSCGHLCIRPKFIRLFSCMTIYVCSSYRYLCILFNQTDQNSRVILICSHFIEGANEEVQG